MSAPRESPLTWTCTSEAATHACAAEIAGRLQFGDIVLLQGDLGAGKTTFSRALIRHLSENPDLNVPSPTFTLLQTYDTAEGTIWHYDLYRLKDPDEIFELGWEDALAGGLVLIEWPDRLGPHQPKKTITIELQPVPGQPDARIITMTDENRMTTAPTHAFVPAAGLGTRLRPHTDTLPKPLVPVQGRALLDYIFDHLKNAGIQNVTVNLHHKAEVLRDFLAKRLDLNITQSFEEELLETGGGIKKALDTLGSNPFFIINGDAFWIDAPQQKTLQGMAETFNSDIMDMLLLLQPLENMTLTKGVGDYDRSPDGQIVRSLERTGKFMFAGIMICHPRVFENSPEGKFSMRVLMDQAQQNHRLYSFVNPGDWHHISTPEDLEAVNTAMAGR